MLKPADNWFMTQAEPAKSCLQFLRQFILAYDTHLTETWKYGMPMYCYDGKMFCYLWVHKKNGQPYLGIVDGALIDHPALLQEKRARMKILLFDPEKDVDIKMLRGLLRKMVTLRK
ncbi:MAG: DUF1801 domain-containing protein [Chitinophagaceae bacterium]|nr:DUF1801 domain-containing protein [Chitinophagaceae bacterium]